jgi:hypothetical protein
MSETITLLHLAEAGRAMREAQNAYFKGGERGRSDRLALAKQAEHRFDYLIKRVLTPDAPSLFDEES